jgi:hypothetical protein
VNISLPLVALPPLVLTPELTGALVRLLALDNTLLMDPINTPRWNNRPKPPEL